MNENTKLSVVDLLLGGCAPNVRKSPPTMEYEIPRLSACCDAPIIFTLRALSYEEFSTIRALGDDQNTARIVLKGVTNPDFNSESLKAQFSAATALECVGAMLLDGEINKLCRYIEKLSGYDLMSIKEVKNDSGTAVTGN